MFRQQVLYCKIAFTSQRRFKLRRSTNFYDVLEKVLGKLKRTGSSRVEISMCEV